MLTNRQINLGNRKCLDCLKLYSAPKRHLQNIRRDERHLQALRGRRNEQNH